MKSKVQIVDINGEYTDTPDFPVAVVGTQMISIGGGKAGETVKTVDPIFDRRVYGNLYGRVMTLVEATTDVNKLDAVKNIFSKELDSWSKSVYDSAREIADGGNSSENIYTKNNGRLS